MRRTAALLALGVAWLAVACGGDEDASPSPEAVTRALGDRFWSYEVWAPAPGTTQPVHEADSLFFAEDGTYERYVGFEPIQRGRWSVTGDGLSLAPEGPAPTTLTWPIVESDHASLTLELPGPDGALVRRTFRPSARCPAWLSRHDGRSAVHFLGIHDQSTQFEGSHALGFDAQGDLHVVASRFNARTEGYYLTTYGARCGLRRFAFAPQAHAVMRVDGADNLHVAYAEETRIQYATRPARAPETVPWTVTTVATNALTPPRVALAVAPSGAVAVAATRDDGTYSVFRSLDPLAPDGEWQLADLPLAKQPGNDLLFGVALAFDPDSRLHVAATAEGAHVTVHRDEGGAFRPFVLPDLPVVGAFFEGPDSFAIDPQGRWHLAAGSIGQPDSRFGAGRPGPLVYGTGEAGAVTWRVVGAGGTASLALDDRGRVHLHSLDRIFGGLHTVLDGDRVDRHHALARESTLDRMAMAVGPGGRAAFGVADAVQVALPPEELPELRMPARVRLADARGARVVLPEIDAACDGDCAFDVTDGRWLQWRWETPPGVAPVLHTANTCRGRELTGDCWVFVGHGACRLGECPAVIDMRFAASEVSAFHDVAPAGEDPAGWILGGPSAGSGMVATLARPGPAPLSLVARWSADARPLGAWRLPGWGGIESAVWTAGDRVVAFGSTDGATVIGDEGGFAGEDVVVGLDDAGAVRWVHRTPAANFPTGAPIAVGGDVAFFGAGAVERLDGEGRRVHATPLDAVRRDAFLVAAGDEVHVLGPLREEVAQSPFHVTRWTRIGADGTVRGEVDVPGWVLGAAPDAGGRLALAVALRQGQPWGDTTAPADALALAIYAADGRPVELGAPDDRHFAAAGSLSGWAPLAAGAALRDDGTLLVAQQIQSRVTVLFAFGRDAVDWKVQLGGQGAFGGGARTFVPTGLASLGPRRFLGGTAHGELGADAVTASYQTPTPVLVELP